MKISIGKSSTSIASNLGTSLIFIQPICTLVDGIAFFSEFNCTTHLCWQGKNGKRASRKFAISISIGLIGFACIEASSSPKCRDLILTKYDQNSIEKKRSNVLIKHTTFTTFSPLSWSGDATLMVHIHTISIAIALKQNSIEWIKLHIHRFCHFQTHQ